MTNPPRVRFDAVSKRYSGVQALDGVSFDVAPACIHALVGENGAGKSTLMRVLAGATRPDSGRILLDGRAFELRNAHDAQSAGVAVVYQEFNLVGDLSVSENVFLGRWPSTAGLLRFTELHSITSGLLHSLGVALPVERRVGGLSAAQRQIVEIARALSLSAKVLVLDEPSAALTPHELRSLFGLVRRLAKAGTSIIYISHRLEEIFQLADFVTVLKDGRHVSTRPIADATRDTLVREMVGRPLEEEFPSRKLVRTDVALRVSGLTSRDRFRDVGFEIHAGEVFGLTGLVGSGRSSVARAIFGALPVTAGRVEVGRHIGPFSHPRNAQRAGVAFLPEDRRLSGLLLHRSVRENVTLAHLNQMAWGGWLSKRQELRVTGRMAREMRIRAAHPEAPAATLSGGNQQKAMLARWLQRPYPVIILDEPTRGVDVGARVEIYGLINGMAQGGAAILLVTSELPEAIGMADRIGVMRSGRLCGILDNADRTVTEEEIMHLAIGGDARVGGTATD